MENHPGHPDQQGMADQGFRSLSLLLSAPATAQQHASSSVNTASIPMPLLPSHPDRRSICPMPDDGYDWRKLGIQEFPGWGGRMSSYICSQAHCGGKKLVVRSSDGQIVETVYQGSHNHSRSSQWPRDATAELEPGIQDYIIPVVSAAGTSMGMIGEGGEQLPSSSDSDEDGGVEARADGDDAGDTDAPERSVAAPAERRTLQMASQVLDDCWQQGANCYRSERRRSKSKVWEEFIPVLSGGKIQSAECKHCKKCLSGKSSGGTSHLRRHLKICPAQPIKGRVQQHRSVSHPDSSVEKNLKFDQDKSLEFLTKALVCNHCCFSLTSSTYLKQLLSGIGPIYGGLTQGDIGEKVLCFFKNEKLKLKEKIALAPGGVFLAVASWGQECRVFRCVIVYFIDKEWNMNRKIISVSFWGDEADDGQCYLSMFPDWQSYLKRQSYFDASCLSDKITTATVKEVVQDWSMEQKLLGVALPNSHSPATLAMEENLTAQNYLLAKYKLLTLPCIVDALQGLFGFNGIKNFVVEIGQEWFQYMTCSPLHTEKYKGILSQLHLDRPVFGSQKWYMTFYLLEAALQFNKAFPDPKQLHSRRYLSCQMVEVAENFCDVARPIYHAIKVVSSPRNLTLNSHFHAVWSLKIALLSASRKANIDKVINVEEIQTKFDKLWRKWYLWLSLAIVLDPRYKIRFLDFFFKQAFDSDAKRYIIEVRGKMYELFLQYSCYVDQQNDVHINLRNNDLQLETHCSVPVHITSQNYNEQWSHGGLGELIGYLEEELIPQNVHFEILKWWKANASSYPTLSRLARDILAIPGCTVSAESAFDETDERVSLFNRKVSPEVVEALICTQDWIKSSEISEVGGN